MFRMTLAIVIVFPEPVTPSSVWNRSPRSRPARQLRDRPRLVAGGLEGRLEVEFRVGGMRAI